MTNQRQWNEDPTSWLLDPTSWLLVSTSRLLDLARWSAYIVATSWLLDLPTLSSPAECRCHNHCVPCHLRNWSERGCCNFVLDGRGSVQTTDWIVLPPVANRCILIVAELRELMKSLSPWNIMFFESVILPCLMFSSLVLILFTVLLNFFGI